MSVASQAPARAVASGATRWGQLIFGIICMVMIANLQYGWTLFVNPIDQKYHWGRAAIQVAFTIFVLTETWLVPIANMIASSGYEAAFWWFGIGQGVVVILVALLLRAPEAGEVVVPAAPAVQQTRRDYTPAEVLAPLVTSQFYKSPFLIMYLMFVMVGAGGLMAIAQLAPIANDYKIAGVPVSILGLTLPALTFALTIDRVLNGICRPFFGWVSDHIGRENTMFIAFFIEGIGIYALLYFASNPFLFVILSGVVFFAWGEIYSLFPATCTDIYGRKFATTNYGMLYTAKGTASLLVPLANVLTTYTGSWHAVFYVAAIANIVAAVMALAVLRPLRQKFMAQS